jgi:hypothetical protein
MGSENSLILRERIEARQKYLCVLNDLCGELKFLRNEFSFF